MTCISRIAPPSIPRKDIKEIFKPNSKANHTNPTPVHQLPKAPTTGNYVYSLIKQFVSSRPNQNLTLECTRAKPKFTEVGFIFGWLQRGSSAGSSTYSMCMTVWKVRHHPVLDPNAGLNNKRSIHGRLAFFFVPSTTFFAHMDSTMYWALNHVCYGRV